jgi:serine/threonine protein kinase
METIGRYNIIAELGRGATGTVLKAHDRHLNRLVAIKVLSPSSSSHGNAERAAEMFSLEARTIARLVHPGIVQIYDVFDDPQAGSACMVMEYVGGGTLASLLAKGCPLPLDRALELTRQIAGALEFAHTSRFLHLDLKPANILLTEDGQVKIADFGLARFLGRVGSLATDSINGTPAYLSPERVKGEVPDERSDVFSLGVIFYQMLTGRLAFNGDVSSILYSILNTDPTPPARLNFALTREYDELVAKCLNKDPEQRTATVAEFTEALDKLPCTSIPVTLNGPVPLFPQFATSANGKESVECVAGRVERQNAAKKVARPKRSRTSKRKRPGWPLTNLSFVQGRTMQWTALVFLSLALGGTLWPDLRQNSAAVAMLAHISSVPLPLTGPDNAAASVFSGLSPETHSFPGLISHSNRLVSDAFFNDGGLASISAASIVPWPNPDQGSAPTFSTRKAAKSDFRRPERASHTRWPQNSEYLTPASSWFKPLGASAYHVSKPADSAPQLPDWVASTFSHNTEPETFYDLPFTSAASDQRNVKASGQPPAKQLIRFKLDYDISAGTLTVSADGKAILSETLKGRSRSLLGFSRSWHGLVSHVLFVPQGTQNISVEIVNSDQSVRMEDMLPSANFGSGRGMLLAEVRSGTIHLKWTAATER